MTSHRPFDPHAASGRDEGGTFRCARCNHLCCDHGDHHAGPCEWSNCNCASLVKPEEPAAAKSHRGHRRASSEAHGGDAVLRVSTEFRERDGYQHIEPLAAYYLSFEGDDVVLRRKLAVGLIGDGEFRSSIPDRGTDEVYRETVNDPEIA